MEALRFAAVLLALVLVQVFGALATPSASGDQDAEKWTVENWRGFPPDRGVSFRLAELIKRSKAQQFHGLMGRSSSTLQPGRLGRKRNKGEMFVGLMGRRSPGGDTEELSRSDSY